MDRALRVVRVRIDETDRLPGAKAHPAPGDRHDERWRGEQRHDVIGAVAWRAVAMAVVTLVPRQQAIQSRHQVGIRSGADLDDHEPGRGVWHEQRQQPVPGGDVAQERGAFAGQVRQPAPRTRPDREVAGVYGKMLRSASRSRPRPPRAGADS